MITNRRTNIISEKKINNNKKLKFKLNFKPIFIDYIKNNIREFFCVISLLLIGIILSIIFINNVNEMQKNEITSYIQDYISNLKEGKNINKKAVFWDSIKYNAIFTITLWFGGLTIIGIPIVYITIIFKGFTLGYTISVLIAILGTGKGSMFVFCAMFLQNIIAIPCILTIAVSGIKIYKVIVKDKRKENMKLEICRHTITSLLFFNILIIESFISGYLSTLIIENIIKFI